MMQPWEGLGKRKEDVQNPESISSDLADEQAHSREKIILT